MHTYSIIDFLPIVFATLLVLFLPGWAWQAWFPRHGRDALENLGEAAALSVSVTAVLALVTHLAGIRWTGAMLIGVYALLAFAALAG
ncbi:MAG TPA: hypothetical protein VHO48_09605, partial [Anaerolineaceae bacterium]|nr:hypothetical protein [Anaerolineaceae bacterium]